MKGTTVGIDVAKSIFQRHGVDGHGKVALQQRVTRAKLRDTIAQLPPCLIGREACGSAQYWVRELQQLGHTVKLISPQFVKPYVKGNKTDSRDAEAICEAVSRPHMRFVPRKTVESQDSVVAYFPLCPMPLFSTHGQYALCGSLSHPALARVQPRVDQPGPPYRMV